MNHSNDCKSKWRFKTQWMAIAFACLSIFTFSCDEEEANKEELTPEGLRYALVSEVYEGKAMETSRPVVYSTSNPKFEITSGTAEEGGTYIEGEFQVIDTTGIITLKLDNQLVAGKYFLDIKVSNDAGETIFPKAFELVVLPSAIERLQYSPLNQVIVRGVEGQKTTIPEFKGTNPVTFALSKNSDFVIDTKTGEISLAIDSQIDAGEYRLSVVATNVTGEQTFEEVVRIDVQTLPYDLVYSTNAYLGVQQTQAKQSVEPAINGTGPVTYSLKNNFNAFTIDPLTGVVSLPEAHTLAIDTYNLTVVATNEHGSVDFVDALSFEIIAIQAIIATDLTYVNVSYSVNQAFAFTSDIPTVSGSTPTYSLLESFGEFGIDPVTGVISLTEGNTLAIGNYPMTVVASNLAGDAIFTDVISVTVKAAVVELIFEDGWDELTPAVGETRLGNMIEYSAKEAPKQATNNKWTRGWGNWSVIDQDGVTVRGAVMIPEKTENDDWLIAKDVDLSKHVDSYLNLDGYSRYGSSNNNTLKLLVSENYSGDVSTAVWEEVSFETFFNYTKAQSRVIDLSKFDGKVVTIALRHESFLIESDAGSLTNLTRTSYILNFQVMGTQK
ncbi:DUF4958 domain-containing protein [Ancylomarina euxinus]|uniref:DUF4958 domain-containing protein n=1 Tax=Ancylomarina euxinus TaxID=2283627 RepID=A0A425XZ56_9BACT|nr:surface glycan-binding family protein [Ancylomarina euxinus]MCZ4694772.1 DUF4958 family protein [Ancylomarina euxinus]MUP15846.1 DUF4958 domain-containing protein [Ancylomarina euxinus]RRG20486.1 DUF4958 domain-containing protein [Ancylomarina euxinus]